MSTLFWLSEKQLNRISPYFPLSRGVPRVDRPPCDQRHYLCDQEWPALVRCAA